MPDHEELLTELLDQERRIQFRELTNETALKIGMRLVEVAMAESLPVTVDICRNGQQIFHCAMSGTSPDNDEWIKRKNRVVNRFGHSSFYMGCLYRSQGTTIDEKHLLDPREFAPHGGAFPIIIRNVGPVGTVTASGLPQEEDHKLVVRVLSEFADRV